MKAKKIIGTIISLCMLLNFAYIPVQADGAEMTAVPADGATDVVLTTDRVKLTFDDFPDISTFTEETVTINGIGVPAEEIVYDDMNAPFDVVLKLATPLEEGTRYVVRLDNVTVGTETEYCAVTRFTTEMGRGRKTAIDFDGYVNYTMLWGCTHDVADGVYKYTSTADYNGSRMETLSGIDTADIYTMVIRAKANEEQMIKLYYRTTELVTESEAQCVTTTVPGDGQWHDIEVDISALPRGGILATLRLSLVGMGCVEIDYIQFIGKKQYNSTLISVYDFRNEQDYFTHSVQMGTVTKTADGIEIRPDAEEVTMFVNDGRVLSNQFPNIQISKIEKIVFRAKRLPEAGMQTDAKLVPFLFDNWYGYHYEINPVGFELTDEFQDYEFDLRGQPDSRILVQMGLWVTKPCVVQSIILYPYNYTETPFVVGSLQEIKDYGIESEKIISQPEAGNLSAVLSGIINATGEEQEILLVNALYQGNKLVDVAVAEKTLVDGEGISEPMIATLENVPENDGTYTVKKFLWNGMKMIPLA